MRENEINNQDYCKNCNTPLLYANKPCPECGYNINQATSKVASIKQNDYEFDAFAASTQSALDNAVLYILGYSVVGYALLSLVLQNFFIMALAISPAIMWLILHLNRKESNKQVEYIYNKLSEEPKTEFLMRYKNQKKSASAGILLICFLGGFGAHQFYMGNNLLGVLYILFCWTCVPLIVSIFEVFFMPTRIKTYNLNLAIKIRDTL